jgi:mannose-6-phosphate isomerase
MEADKMNLVSWMREDALPFWAANGLDTKYGGFVEELKQDGSPSDVGFKRVRVQSRQLYSFSIAALLGWNKDAGAIADRGYEYLKKTCKAVNGRWVRRIARDGSVLDANMDLYDTAFIVLGFVTYHRLSGKREPLDLIENTIQWVNEDLSTLSKKGYRQSVVDKDVLRQNPNMHWFEAMLFCYEATKDQRYLDEAKKIYRLASENLIDSKTGVLRELFDNQWKPIREDGKILVEPGHHYEWTWLLNRAGRHFAVDQALIPKVSGFADQYGVNPQTGIVYDQVSDEGEVTQPSTRLWVLTETIKAWLVRTDVTEEQRKKRIQELETALLQRYLLRKPMGTWGDRLDGSGRMMGSPVPASSMYHIMLCVTELAAWRALQPKQ